MLQVPVPAGRYLISAVLGEDPGSNGVTTQCWAHDGTDTSGPLGVSVGDASTTAPDGMVAITGVGEVDSGTLAILCSSAAASVHTATVTAIAVG